VSAEKFNIVDKQTALEATSYIMYLTMTKRSRKNAKKCFSNPIQETLSRMRPDPTRPDPTRPDLTHGWFQSNVHLCVPVLLPG